MTDSEWMAEALRLSERGRGCVEPNPMVGAVIVRDGVCVGRGWHKKYGEAHAEVNALLEACGSARGATLYVTLEPCCHHGKTPPCTDAILRAGIARVVVAMLDPFPEVAGKGIERLRAGGVQVDVGQCHVEATELNQPYLTLITKGRPYVHAKWAMSLDGKIATRTGDSKWISGTAARQRVHELRGRVDAIVVGTGTVRADDPLLTARPPGPRLATRVVLSTSGELRSDCQLFRTIDHALVLIATLAGRGEAARRQGCEVIELPTERGRPSVTALVQELGRRRMTNVLVEGGAGVLGSFFDAGLIDEIHVFIAPILIGGADAKGAIGGKGVEQLAGAVKVANWQCELIPPDFYFRGRIAPSG